MAGVEGGHKKTEVLHATCIFLVHILHDGPSYCHVICQAGDSKSGQVQSTSLTLLPVLWSEDNPEELGLSLHCVRHIANSGQAFSTGPFIH